jgi:hypothetical protein
VVTQNLSDAQLLLPLLDEIAKAGGMARPGEVYDRLAARLAIPDRGPLRRKRLHALSGPAGRR